MRLYDYAPVITVDLLVRWRSDDAAVRDEAARELYGVCVGDTTFFECMNLFARSKSRWKAYHYRLRGMALDESDIESIPAEAISKGLIELQARDAIFASSADFLNLLYLRIESRVQDTFRKEWLDWVRRDPLPLADDLGETDEGDLELPTPGLPVAESTEDLFLREDEARVARAALLGFHDGLRPGSQSHLCLNALALYFCGGPPALVVGRGAGLDHSFWDDLPIAALADLASFLNGERIRDPEQQLARFVAYLTAPDREFRRALYDGRISELRQLWRTYLRRLRGEDMASSPAANV